MSNGLTQRNHPRNEMDVDIVKKSLHQHITCTAYFGTLSWKETKEILAQVIKEIDDGAEKHPTFDGYYCDL